MNQHTLIGWFLLALLAHQSGKPWGLWVLFFINLIGFLLALGNTDAYHP